MRIGRIIVLASESGVDNWKAVPPESIPEWIKDPQTMGYLVAGDMAQADNGEWYRAHKIEDTPIVVPPEAKLTHKREVLDKLQ